MSKTTVEYPENYQEPEKVTIGRLAAFVTGHPVHHTAKFNMILTLLQYPHTQLFQISGRISGSYSKISGSSLFYTNNEKYYVIGNAPYLMSTKELWIYLKLSFI